MHSLVRDYIQFSRVTEYAQSSQVLCTVYSLAMQSLVGLLTMHSLVMWLRMHSYTNYHFLCSTPESPAASAECGNLLDRSPTCLLNRRDTHWWLGGVGGMDQDIDDIGVALSCCQARVLLGREKTRCAVCAVCAGHHWPIHQQLSALIEGRHTLGLLVGQSDLCWILPADKCR